MSPEMDDPYRPPSPRRRDASAGWMASSVWSQGGESYAEQYSSTVGSPGQDLSRYTEGPSAYLNGPPNVGPKCTMERRVHNSPRGRFQQGVNTGPAQYTQIVAGRKMACKRSAAGPDPYGIGAANLWVPNPAHRAYATFLPENGFRRTHLDSAMGRGERTPWVYGRTATHAFDPCEHRGPSIEPAVPDALAVFVRRGTSA